jgi:uncharacterized membrane protein YphA (DoxX/SURF4 family)
MSDERKLESTFLVLRLTYGLVPVVAGLDKFTNLLVDWKSYIAPFAAERLPMSPATFMGVVGVIEIVAGLVVLLGFTRVGGYVVAAWLAAIAANLVLAGHYDIAVRDLVMAVGSFSLARLAEYRDERALARERTSARALATAG